MNTPVTIYLADDHQIIIDGLKLLISDETSLKVVGYANDGDKAYKDILAWKPDVALVDIRMPGMNGLDIVLKLSRVLKDTRFVILSVHDQKREIRDAMKRGAVGYLLKNTGRAELMKCLSLVLNGELYFPTLPAIKETVEKDIFTPRELDIVKLIIQRRTTQQIADELCLSKHTVDVHRKNIGRKTNTSTPLALKDFLEDNHIEL
jgi:two-component system nitrate/nitrite response regulator NarL